MTSRVHPQPLEIGRVIRDGVVFDFKNWKGAGVNADALIATVARLFALLDERRIPYLLVGGVAMLQYVEGRNTQDIDLIVDASALAKLPEVEVTGRTEEFARGRFAELRIDFLLGGHPLFDLVRRKYAARQNFHEREIPCATVEGLLLLKLYALPSLYRQGSFARVGLYENDIATLLQAYRPALDPLLEELRPHLTETDLAEIRGILAEIQARVRRFEEGRKSE